MNIASKLRKTANGATAVDGEVAKAVEPLHEGRAGKALAAVSKLGDQPHLMLMSSALVVAGLLSSNRRLAGAGARMLFAHEVATLAKDFVKYRIDRTRPRSARRGEQRKLKPPRSTAKEESSFPSGHGAGTFAVARAFAREYPGRQPAALATAGALSAVQVTRSAHYLSDAVAGAAIGWAAEAAANLAWPIAAATRDSEKAKASSDG